MRTPDLARGSRTTHLWLLMAIPFLALAGATAKIHADGTKGASAGEMADLVVLHAKVYTENSSQPQAQALAVAGDKILAVGSEAAIERYRGPATKVIDAAGRAVLPGFTDCHIHLLESALQMDEPDLSGARNAAEIEKILRVYGAGHPGSGWVLGIGWTYDAFPGGMPDKKMLDEIFPDRPVYIDSYDGHSAWVNSKALEAAGITRTTPDPANGNIVRDPKTGEATGALKETATGVVQKVLPKATKEEKWDAARKAMALANANGLVRVHSAGGDFDSLAMYEEMKRKGELTLRIYAAKIIDPPHLTPDDLKDIEIARTRYHDDWVEAGAAKFFMDGVVESHTAAMLAPYADDPSASGTPNWKATPYNQAVLMLNQHGIQVFTHAIGDRAVRMALDAYARSAQTTGHADVRDRVEHIETISPQDVPRFAKIGVIASMQPLHANPDADTSVWAANVGLERVKLAFAWKTLETAGARLAFGSDWNVVTLNPWAGVQCAVTRQTPDGQPAGGWIPAERISVTDAIAAYTIGAAYAGHREKTEGSLEPGKLADFIIVDRDPFAVDPHQIGGTQVIETIVGGRVVFEAAARK
ncbi:MAG: amidohydrolase [Candidatus Acidiferrales bacterium]